MYLLYLDDSGSAGNKKERHLVLGGICVYEHQVHHFTHELDALAATLRGEAVAFFLAQGDAAGRRLPWADLFCPFREFRPPSSAR